MQADTVRHTGDGGESGVEAGCLREGACPRVGGFRREEAELGEAS